VSFRHDLLRNRRVFRLLSADEGAGQRRGQREPVSEWAERPVFQDMAPAAQEWGQVPRQQFEKNLAAMEQQGISREMPVYSLRAPYGADRADSTPKPDPARTVPDNASAGVRVVPVAYPEPSGDRQDQQSGEDLLDSLLRRIESSARRYPQNLREEE